MRLRCWVGLYFNMIKHYKKQDPARQREAFHNERQEVQFFGRFGVVLTVRGDVRSWEQKGGDAAVLNGLGRRSNHEREVVKLSL